MNKETPITSLEKLIDCLDFARIREIQYLIRTDAPVLQIEVRQDYYATAIQDAENRYKQYTGRNYRFGRGI